MPDKPLIAITQGDPAGIGSEVIAKAFLDQGMHQICKPFVVGSGWVMRSGCEAGGVDLKVCSYPNLSDMRWADDQMSVLELSENKPKDFQFGQVSAACGTMAVNAVETAARLCLTSSDQKDGEHPERQSDLNLLGAGLLQQVAAMVTAPLNKEAIHMAGFTEDIGHQEILARLCRTSLTSTVLMTPGLRVMHLSTHKSLIEAAKYVTRDVIVSRIHLAVTTFRQWGLEQPRIAVAALNPHGGEGGLIGREEIEEILPAVEHLRTEGFKVSGPIPADSVFNRAIAGEFDLVLALYHDQGHIAIKVHNFHESVTATLGIPFIRTSVDHGTAFDIAGSGCAKPDSMLAAIRMAVRLANGQL